MDEEQQVTVTGVVRDEGTLVVFSGLDEEGREITFAVDHRMAQAIVDSLDTSDEDTIALVPDWAVLT